MGQCVSVGTKEERERTRQIDEQLKKDKRAFETEAKLLLLGAGESGKSTIVKQMRLLYLSGFSDSEKQQYKHIIYSNILSSMRILVEQARARKFSISKKNRNAADRVAATDDSDVITPALAEDIKLLWKDKGIKQTLDKSAEFQLLDSVTYYVGEIDRIAEEDYVPSEDDILHSRVKTTGILETEFTVQNQRFRMVDVGGQRSERKKWIHCFQDVTAVLFLVALSEYDMTLVEDERVNRMHESLKLFDEICNSRWFRNVSIILFLNKKDIFERKITKSPLTTCFPDYTGANNFEEACAFIQGKFMSMNRDANLKQVYPHVTCATDTKNVEFVFRAVRDIVIRKALDVSGF